MTERRLLISFSGGETSAYMTLWILRNWRGRYDRIVIVFANTGEENEATLEFVRLCDERLFRPLGFAVVWIEAVIFPGERRGPSFSVVDFASASRRGEPFEAMIRKYGIPNPKFKHCTRALKRRPIEAYAKALGWELGDYDTAIGIRADEIDRMNEDRDNKRIVYPLVREHPTTKPQINHWWARMNWRLQLKGYQGNCRWCWKKSFRKLLTIRGETPEAFDFPRRMELEYAKVGPEFAKDPPPPEEYRRTFFRENKSVADLDAMWAGRGPSFVPAEDDTAVWAFSFELDAAGGCEESCEVWGPDDADPEPEGEERAA